MAASTSILAGVFPDRTRLPHAASRQSLSALSWMNFFLADMLTGFGPFVTLFLLTRHWTQGEIGVALSVGSVASLVAQVPAGALVDELPGKRVVTGVALLAIAAAMLILVWLPSRWPVYGAEVLQGVAGAVITPAVAAITLALANQEKLGERLGQNVRWQALGSGVAALLMGSVGGWLGYGSVFYLGAGFGLLAIVAMALIRSECLDSAPSRTGAFSAVPKRRLQEKPVGRADLPRDRQLLGFAAAIMLFQLGNAAVLNIAAHGFLRDGANTAGALLAATIAVPQVIAALIAPRLGNLAETWGRRRVLLLGFAVVPIRILLFALGGTAWMKVGYQAFDGFTAALLGLMIPLVVADITHDKGRFSLAMGWVGLASGVGAALGVSIAGFVAERLGDRSAYLTLAVFAVAASVTAWFAIPETRGRCTRQRAGAIPAAA